MGRTPALAPGAHPHHAGRLDLDVQVNQRSGRQWVLSREPYFALALQRCAMPTPWGVQALTPELVLFYKTFDTRPHDEADLHALLPRLSADRVAWLREAIAHVHPGHAWRELLAVWGVRDG